MEKMNESLSKFFKIWLQKVSFAKYDRWCEENYEMLIQEKKNWLEEKIPYDFHVYYKLV